MTLKNHWFLLFGFGFLFAGFARFASTSLAIPALPFEKNASEEMIEMGEEPFTQPIEELETNSAFTDDEISKISLNANGQPTVADTLETPGTPSDPAGGGVKDEFIENSFVTVSDQPQNDRNPAGVTDLIPDRIVIPDIQLDAPIVLSQSRKVTVEGKPFDQWLAPDKYAAGWQSSSAHLGEIGNTVINGHHNEFGEVFKRLIDLDAGDEIIVYAGEKKFEYVIANRLVLPERKVKLETRISNARWIQHSKDERLTLVTCWPYENNTHRLILVAVPNR